MALVLDSEYTSPEGVRTLANFLRSSNGVAVRPGQQMDKRVDYFKGKRMVECLINGKKWPKSLPKVTTKEVALALGDLLIKSGFIHRSEKHPGHKGVLLISKSKEFEENGYYTWIYQGNLMWSHIATGLLIATVVGFTLLPLWPMIARKALWYLSVTFLLCTTVFCLVRWALFIILWIVGIEFWILPRLFDESLSFVDSFKPIYSYERGAAGQGLYRVFLILCLGGLGYWAMTQPVTMDELMDAQKTFVDDLYSGKLLPDMETMKNYGNINNNNNKRTGGYFTQHNVPKLEEVLKSIEESEEAELAQEHTETAVEFDPVIDDQELEEVDESETGEL